jgi:hypothetical protein
VAVALAFFQATTDPQSAYAVNAMNYGADGNDYYRFTNPSMDFDRASGFTTLITFAMHVNPDGTLLIGGDVACTNGVYTGSSNWNSLITTLKTQPTTVTRYEVCIGGWTDTSFDNIKSLVTAQGTGANSILYKNFQALKNAVPGIDAINDDDEQTYDLNSSTKFANLLGGLGYAFTLAPYNRSVQTFWVNLKTSSTNCDYVYLQCYAGGAGNDPAQWNTAFGHGVVVIPGQESNGSTPANFRNWYLQTGAQGGFYYPDVVFNNTYWSAAIIEANGAVPAMPAGFTAVAGGQQVNLSWNMVPGAISYNVKRSTTSGAEINIASISTANTPWPGSNQYFDTGLVGGTTYYYQVSAVNANGESTGSAEVSAVPQAATVFGFETPSLGLGNYLYNPSGGSWTFNGASPNGSGIIANGSAFGNPNAPEGVQAAFVQEFGSISQSLSGFVPGTNYTITFSAAERGGNNQSWNIKTDNTVIGSYNPGSSAASYSDYTATFTAAAITHTVSFVGTDLAGGDNTIFIDNVRISPPLLSVPVVVRNTLPATAADVVGDQVTFTADINGTNLVYQWQKIKSGVTNNIAAATNTTLTLTNLQISDAASYRLRATNVYGVGVSSPAVLTVNAVPGAVNNVVTKFAAQTGLGSASANFAPIWTVAPGSLIAGRSPVGVGSGNFSAWGTGVVPVLTDGVFGSLNLGGAGSLTEVMCGDVAGGAGQSVTYALTGSTTGYNLTNITVYGGWGDAGRDQQAYTLYYSKVSAPANFILLSSVSYNPANPASVQSATRATLLPASGFLATNVATVKIDFTTPTPENDSCGYSEIQVFGTPSVIPPATNPTNITFQVAAGSLTLSWPADHIGWRLQAQTNGPGVGLNTNWSDVANSTTTNQVTIIINPADGGVFYRMVSP